MRFFTWLFSRRILARMLCGLLTLLTLMVLFYTEEKVRGRRAWNRCRSSLQQQGYSVEVKTITPASLPEAQNFARAPQLKPLYDYVHNQKKTDTNAYQQFQTRLDAHITLAKKMGFESFLNSQGMNWRSATPLNPVSILGKRKQPPQENQETPPETHSVQTPPPLTPEAAAKLILEIYQQTNGPLLDELQSEVQKRPVANFNIQLDTDNPFAILLPHLAFFKSMALKCTSRALAELYLKQSEAGFKDTLFSLQLSDALTHEPFLIGGLVQIAMRDITLNAVWHGLATRQWTASQIVQLQVYFEKINALAEMYRCLESERIMGNRGIEGFARQFPHRMTFSSFGGSFDDNNDSFVASSAEIFVSHLYPKGWFYFEQVNYQNLFVECYSKLMSTNQPWLDLKPLDAASKRVETELSGQGIKALFQHKIMSALLLPSLGNAMRKAAISQAAITLATTACALERYRLVHNSHPTQLAELVPQYLKHVPIDPVNGKPLVYRLKPDGSYILYSLGENGVDDGGKVVLNKSGINVNLQEGDWVWTYPEHEAK